MLRRLAALVMAAILVVAGDARAQQGTCARQDFEAAVDDAAATLRDLNQKHRPTFQDKLRALKDKRGWSHDQFLEAAAPYVKDETIIVYDQKAESLLAEISSLGEEGSQARQPDCALLASLKQRMGALVDIQTEKWRYMFGKLEKALAE
ncbi:MAG: hypothetical protein NW205_05510 [Hyphomicrobiaceae bacterium]|nr:hypothetical protein [Hyphomicrobiaceae bacterium]